MNFNDQLRLLKLGAQGSVIAFELRDPPRLGATLFGLGPALAWRQAGHDTQVTLLAPLAKMRGIQALTT